MKNKYISITFFLFCGSFFISPLIWGQSSNHSDKLSLKTRTIELNPNLSSLKNYLEKQSSQPFIQVILSFNQQSTQNTLKTDFINKEGYLGEDAYFCTLSTRLSNNEKLSSAGIKAWAKVLPKDKINPLINFSHDRHQQIDLLIKLTTHYKQEKLTTLLGSLEATRAERQLYQSQNILQIRIEKSKITTLAAAPFIRYIQPKFKPKALDNSLAVGYDNASVANAPLGIGGYNLLGQGMTAGIGDNSNAHHVDFNDRLTCFSPSVANSHGIHTTGTVGGAGLKDQRYRGFAPRVKLIDDYFNAIIANAATYYDNFGMIVTNNSYALIVSNPTYAGTYDAYSNMLDQQAFDIPKVLHCFAAGNDGRNHYPPYPYSYGTTVSSYSTAKNVLTVAAIGWTHDEVADFSSRGPVKDGRIDPEVTGEGYNLVSTWTNNGYHTDGGTSMATPNVTGSAVLVNQRYQQLKSNTPDNALIKLLLMNGATDIGNAGPDYQYGFGLVNVGNSLKMLDNNQYFHDSLVNHAEKTFTINIPSGTATAKIMLYWNDPPASPMASKALVNDLDLTVTDQSATIYHPLILNAAPTHVTNLAMQGTDHTNNVEQVTLNNPSSGSYTIHVKGYDIPMGRQKFYVAYSFIPKGIFIQYPYGGEALEAGSQIYIYWQASKGNKPFTLSFSTDDGNNWQAIQSNIPSDKRAYHWTIPSNVHSSKCRLKIMRQSETNISHKFTISGRPEAILPDNNDQCPGNIYFSWHPINGISQYKIFRKWGDRMKAIGSTTDTNYTITGLDPDSLYWVAVAPIVDGKTGMRSVAFSYQPDQGNCSLITQHGDLSINEILNPTNGRKLTQIALTNSTALRVKVQNRDNQSANNYSIFWQLNNGSWHHHNYSTPTLSAGASQTLTSTLNLNMAAPGTYTLKVAIVNNSMIDPIPENDTIIKTIRQLPNPPMTLMTDYLQDFETFSPDEVIGQTAIGVGQSNHWDFAATKKHGRFRTFVNSNVTLRGNRSASLDNTVNETGNINQSSQNYLTGTFNLSHFDAQHNEVRLDFDYVMSAEPVSFDTGNLVWIRGNDTDPWLALYPYQFDAMQPNAIFNSGSLSLSDVLNEHGQNFSTSTQIRFGQRDTSQIESINYGNGLTLDDIHLYTVHHDIQLLSIDSIPHFNCHLSNQVPLVVTVYNSSRDTLYNIPITYMLDSQTVVTENIDSILDKDTVQYRFSAALNLSDSTFHSLSVWVAGVTDTYPNNDSILDFTIRNQPIIDDFPYLENFESNDGDFYTAGLRSSWEYGMPASPTIDHAASGSKAWKTGLSGGYNDLEHSYLYSPCYDISSLTNPMLSFSLATDIEPNPDSTTIYDEAYMEYTTDGIHWTRLGDYGEGFNWYNNPYAKAWTKAGETYWHVATIPLPHVNQPIAFRFVLKTDPGSVYEGVAVDDIHIYDLSQPIYTGDSLQTLTPQNIPSNAITAFLKNNQIIATVNNPGPAINHMTVQRYRHEHFVNLDSSQYYLPESFVIKTENQPGDSVQLSLYILDSTMKRLRASNDCPSCTYSKEIYSMGISKYDGQQQSQENKKLEDDNGGQWFYIPSNKITYIPYDQGYEARLKVNSFSEIWFNSGGPNNNIPLPITFFNFKVRHKGERLAKLSWQSMTDNQTEKYYVQRSDSGVRFHTIAEIPSLQQNGYQYTFVDTPSLFQSFVLYRIVYKDTDGNKYQSKVRRLTWDGDYSSLWIYPNPVRKNVVYLDWMKGTNKNLKWQLFNEVGRLIQKGQTTQHSFEGEMKLNLKNLGLSPGLYYLKVTEPEKEWHFKIIYQQ